MNLFFWKKRQEISCQAYRTQLRELTRSLHLQLGNAEDDSAREKLQSQLTEIESALISDLQNMKRQLQQR